MPEGDLIAQFAARIDSPDAQDAFIYFVGLAATERVYVCRPQIKGNVRDFRFFSESGDQLFAFTVNRAWLLFYLRSPSVNSSLHSFEALLTAFPAASINPSGEWTVKLYAIDDVKRIWAFIKAETADFRSGTGDTTQIGFVNSNDQRCDGHRGVKGNDHLQFAYRMTCLRAGCEHVYGANGSDVFQRKCPRCQSGAQGIAF